MSVKAAELDAALEAYGDVSLEAYVAACDFDHEMAMRAALAATEPLMRERIARELESMAGPWGDERMWMTTGTHIAGLVAAIVRAGDEDAWDADA